MKYQKGILEKQYVQTKTTMLKHDYVIQVIPLGQKQ